MVAEVEQALSQIQALKSPGADGFSAGFFQNSWGIVGNDVSSAVLGVLNGGVFDKSINATNICLIPKVSSPSKVTDYRPISLCNVHYKLISKVLAIRFKEVLPTIISPEQSAFIPGRLITDNIMVAFETLHTMDTRLKGKEGFMALKLDMSKAYDRLEWDFLEAILRRLGFVEQWIHLLMQCVCSVSYSILINGQLHGHIIPSRGIRQGDPLSPFFFIICAEALSSLLQQAGKVGGLTGVPISIGIIRILHLLFADDSLVFCRANLRNGGKSMIEILSLHEHASGQQVNQGKTAVFFSRNTCREDRTTILQGSGVCPVQQYESYLGLPALIGRSRVSTFNVLKDRIWKRIHGWQDKFLTHAGKEILIKAIIQALPTYTMSVFRLPKTITKDINTMMSRFWWGHKDSSHKMAWMAWKGMGRSKKMRGLGFRELDSFNVALLAKQGWRIINFPDSLVARVYQAKYFLGGSFLGSTLGRNLSFIWRSIWNAKSLIQDGMMWRIGDGKNVRIWNDKWVPATPSHTILSPINGLNADATVNEIINQGVNWWNIPLIEQLFPPETAMQICSIPISPRSMLDSRIWGGT